MKIVYEYSHLGGGEILQVRYAKILEEIVAVIQGVSAAKNKVSQEKTKKVILIDADEQEAGV